MNIKELHLALSYIDEYFEYVNCGGCACVASMLATELRPFYPLMTLRSCGSYHGMLSLDHIRSNIDNSLSKAEWSDNGVSFMHLWVEVFIDGTWYALDSNGVHDLQGMYYEWGDPIDGSFTFEELQSLADTDTWNCLFDRDQLPDIQAYINERIGEML